MKETIIGFVLTLIVEVVGAVIGHLRDRFATYFHHEGDDLWENHPEFI